MPGEVLLVSGRELTSWSFGIGEEGVKRNSKGVIDVLIIDDQYPCWYTSAKAVGLNIVGIWLTSEEAFPLVYLEPLIRGNTLCCGARPPEWLNGCIERVNWVLIGGPFPDKIVHMLFGSVNLRCIVSTSGYKYKLPVGWVCQTHKVSHLSMGGVTNGHSMLNVFERNTYTHSVQSKQMPLQDLRSILKSGDSGKLNLNMVLPSPLEPVAEVRYCGHDVILNSSLWPVERPNINVRTQWRGQFWIERKLSPFEKLLAFDVPEKLIRMVPDGLDRHRLLGMIHSPSKSLHGFLIGFRQGPEILHKKRKQGNDSVFPLVSQEDERSIEKRLRKKSKTHEDAYNVESFGSKIESIPKKEDVSTEEPEDLGKEAAKHNSRATKSDDAEVRTHLWDDHLLEGLGLQLQSMNLDVALRVLRTWFLRIWKRHVTRSFFKWYNRKVIVCPKHRRAMLADAHDCISRAADATWWSWDAGSRPFFWRWPSDYLEVSRIGVEVWFDGCVQPWTRKQRGAKSLEGKNLVKMKLDTIQKKNYIESGHIKSLMSFFDVPKGEDNIRMVYDGSASGLNGNLWAPWFSLPTIDCLLRSLEPGYSMADNDVGEMFHNFMLHETLRQYCGLDISLYASADQREKGNKQVWRRWNRLAMGLRPSPYCAVQGMMIAREVILGNRLSESNVFRWDRVRLNLPGSPTYVPSKAWFTKIRKDGKVAADVFIYVDDIRCSAPTQREAWLSSQRTSTVLGFLGLQDAARKRRDPGQETGAWTGSVVWTSNNQLSVLTTQEKWDKTKSHLEWINSNINNPEGLENKRLQSIRGFLVYVSRTYGSLVPYLKGLHATIDSWRYGRSATGWKLRSKKRKGNPREDEDDWLEWDERFGLTQLSTSAPTYVLPVPRFRQDLKCLIELTSMTTPPLRVGRMTTQAKVIYGFGDASKHGFGSSIELPDKSIIWRHGQWRLEEEYQKTKPEDGPSLMEERSSNYRELRNLVEVLESAFNEGLLLSREVFMFTDNSTAESAFFKGTSSSELLFELVLRLRKLEMSGQCVIHMIHVAGTRMIYQGTDGLSRGDKTSGVMSGDSMLSFVPLHLSAFERSRGLSEWLLTECLGEGWNNHEVVNLEASDWPQVLGNGKTYIWTPAPAIADVAVEYMAQAIHKRTKSTHIFICPRLMTARWHRTVLKATDLIFSIPIGSSLWGLDQHEPLIFCISFPLSRNRPWKHGGTPYCEHLRKILPDLFLSDLSGANSVLRECFVRAWGMASM